MLKKIRWHKIKRWNSDERMNSEFRQNRSKHLLLGTTKKIIKSKINVEIKRKKALLINKKELRLNTNRAKNNTKRFLWKSKGQIENWTNSILTPTTLPKIIE